MITRRGKRVRALAIGLLLLQHSIYQAILTGLVMVGAGVQLLSATLQKGRGSNGAEGSSLNRYCGA